MSYRSSVRQSQTQRIGRTVRQYGNTRRVNDTPYNDANANNSVSIFRNDEIIKISKILNLLNDRLRLVEKKTYNMDENSSHTVNFEENINLHKLNTVFSLMDSRISLLEKERELEKINMDLEKSVTTENVVQNEVIEATPVPIEATPVAVETTPAAVETTPVESAPVETTPKEATPAEDVVVSADVATEFVETNNEERINEMIIKNEKITAIEQNISSLTKSVNNINVNGITNNFVKLSNLIKTLKDDFTKELLSIKSKINQVNKSENVVVTTQETITNTEETKEEAKEEATEEATESREATEATESKEATEANEEANEEATESTEATEANEEATESTEANEEAKEAAVTSDVFIKENENSDEAQLQSKEDEEENIKISLEESEN